jgi:drug/metabolite transporter (DMT)-like permease
MNRSYLKGKVDIHMFVEQLTVVSLVGQSSVMFGYLLDVVVLSHELTLSSVLGTILILSSLLTLIRHKANRDSTLSSDSQA